VARGPDGHWLSRSGCAIPGLLAPPHELAGAFGRAQLPVCLGCGAKRLFDEEAFQGYGPFNYELQRLIAWDREQRAKHEAQAAQAEHRSAS
jgi:hypothetical protein